MNTHPYGPHFVGFNHDYLHESVVHVEVDKATVPAIWQRMRDSLDGTPIPAVAVAATQVGVPVNAVYYDLSDFSELIDTSVDSIGESSVASYEPLPLSGLVTELEITDRLLDQPMVDTPEGCLSLPGLYVTTRRYAEINLIGNIYRFANANPRRFSVRLSGFPAIMFQHEYDHLNGRLMTDRMAYPYKYVGPSEDDYHEIVNSISKKRKQLAQENTEWLKNNA